MFIYLNVVISSCYNRASVCLHVKLLLLHAVYLGRHTVRGSSITPVLFIFVIHPAITISTNNRITLCSYYVQLSATILRLRPIVDNVMRLFSDNPK